MRILPVLASLILIAACQETERSGGAQGEDADLTMPDSDDWRSVASAEDASRLGRLHQAWRLARAEAEEKGFSRQVEALGPLVDPNAGLEGRLQPAPGAYRCRVLRIGSQASGRPAFVEGSWERCSVELNPGGDLVLSQTSGAPGAQGRLYPDSARRLVFVGVQSRTEGGASRVLLYGAEPERNQVGVFERIGPERWRLATPWPRTEAKLELLELTR